MTGVLPAITAVGASPVGLSPALDAGLAIGIAVLAALWLARGVVRAILRRGGGGCACPSASGGGGSCGGATHAFREAAARGAAKADAASRARDGIAPPR